MPLCSKPRLLALAVNVIDATENTGAQVWPKFTADFTGPYYFSIGTSNTFTIYARANFIAVNVSCSINGQEYNIPMGNYSVPITFQTSEYVKNIMIHGKVMGWKR